MSKKRHFGPMSAHASSSKTTSKRVAELEPQSSRVGKKRRKRLLSRVVDSDASEARESSLVLRDSSVLDDAARPPQQHSEPIELVSPEETLIYAPPDDEYDEDENFQVIGETDPTEQSDSGNSEGVPVRILTDFAIYECATRQLVPIAKLIDVNLAVNNKMYRASGYVKSHVDDDEYCDDDCDDEDNGNVHDSRHTTAPYKTRRQILCPNETCLVYSRHSFSTICPLLSPLVADASSCPPSRVHGSGQPTVDI